MTPLEKALRLAQKQAGHVSWKQLEELEVSRRLIGHRCRTEEWTRPLSGVYRIGGVRDDYPARLWATALWMGDSGHFTSVSAAHIMKVEGFESPQVVTVARACVPPAPWWLKITKQAEPRPTRNVEGFRVATVEYVLRDLCAQLDQPAIGRVLDEFLRRGMTTIERLQVSTEEWGRWRGSATLRGLVGARDWREEKVRSQFEKRMLAVLRRIASVEAIPDYRVDVRDRSYILDFFLPEVAVGIECHSMRWHMGEKAFRDDVRRHRAIESVGIRVIFFTWDEVRSSPERVESEIRRIVARRREELGIALRLGET